MALLTVSEMKLHFAVNHEGSFGVEEFLTRRDFQIVPGETIELDEAAIIHDNPDFHIMVLGDNFIHYNRKPGTGTNPGTIRFTVFFPTPVHFPLP